MPQVCLTNSQDSDWRPLEPAKSTVPYPPRKPKNTPGAAPAKSIMQILPRLNPAGQTDVVTSARARLVHKGGSDRGCRSTATRWARAHLQADAAAKGTTAT